MPLYDYECAACGRRFEVFHGVNAEPPTSCPLCGRGPVRKVITAAAVHYRGSGWAKKERRTAAASKSGNSGTKDEAGGDESSKESSNESSKDEGSGDAAAATKGSSSKGKTGKTVDKTPAATGD